MKDAKNDSDRQQTTYCCDKQSAEQLFSVMKTEGQLA